MKYISILLFISILFSFNVYSQFDSSNNENNGMFYNNHENVCLKELLELPELRLPMKYTFELNDINCLPSIDVGDSVLIYKLIHTNLIRRPDDAIEISDSLKNDIFKLKINNEYKFHGQINFAITQRFLSYIFSVTDENLDIKKLFLLNIDNKGMLKSSVVFSEYYDFSGEFVYQTFSVIQRKNFLSKGLVGMNFFYTINNDMLYDDPETNALSGVVFEIDPDGYVKVLE